MNAKTLILLVAATIALPCKAQTELPTDSLTRELQEVVVTARQPATKLVGTTLISTIPGSNLANLGNALDVLNQLPMISVQNNNVSVTGRDNIEIFIDGKPMHDEEELRQILSTDIKKIELLMVPGVAYKSTTGAVIKISTRRNPAKGLSVTNQFRLQYRGKCSVSDYLSLNYHIRKWDMFLDGTFNHSNSVIEGTTANYLTWQGRETVAGSSQHNTYPTNAGSIKAGINHSDGDKAFGAYYRYNPERGDFTNDGAEWIDDEAPLMRRIHKEIRSHSHLVSTYYENKFARKYLLHFDGDFKHSVSHNTNATIYPDEAVDDVNSTDRRHSTLWAGKLYLSFPLFKGDFTAGTQDSYTHTSLDYRMANTSVSEYIPSSTTDARQTSVALFALWSRMFGKFNLSAGTRYEYVDYNFTVDGMRDEDVSRRDRILTPDISCGYIFNDDSQVSLSYKMTTVKPPYSQLTGSLTYTGRHEIEGGNPALHDEKMHDIRLFGMWHVFIFQADYTRSFDTYAYVKQVFPSNDLQLLMHPVNIDISALSAYLVWSKSIHNWTPDITAGLYRQWLELGHTTYNKPIFSYYFDNTLSLPKGWNITANIYGSTEGDMHTNRFSNNPFAMDVSVGKALLGKSLTVKFSATDIFNSYNTGWTMNTYGIFVDKHRKNSSRGIQLNIIYRFQPRPSKYKGEPASEQEIKRL